MELTAADLAAMMRPAPEARLPRLAVVSPGYTSGLAPVTFEGEAEVSSKGFPWLAPYSPAPGDRVAMIPAGVGGWIILGGVTEQADADPGTVPISRGGTGATTASGARAALGVYSLAEVDALIVEVIDEVNALVAAHAAEELAARNAAIASHAAAEVTARNAAIAAAFAGGADLHLISPDGTRWRLGVDNAGALTTTEVP